MEALIEKTLLGDSQAYVELIELVKFDLYKIANAKLSNKDYVDDAVQETITKAYKYLYTLENKQYFKTWIIKVVINECNNINKNNNKFYKLHNKVLTSSRVDTSYTLEDDIFIKELLNTLPENDKSLAKLHFIDNLTISQIATLLNSNRNTIKSKLYRIRLKLQKLILIILIFTIITVTTVFAKDLIQYIFSIFTTNRNAVISAVNNNYVQNIDMDFVYDKNIGIKIDYILMDDNSLNVSFIASATNQDDIISISPTQYTILDENANIIYDTYLPCISNDFIKSPTDEIFNNNTFRRSYLYTTTNTFPFSTNLTFNISTITINRNNIFESFNGNWNFDIVLEDKFLNRTTNSYTASSSPYLNNISSTLNETCLNIDIVLNIPLDINVHNLFCTKQIILQNNLNQQYILINSKIGNTNNLGNIQLIFDISQFYKNIDNLNLTIPINEKNSINITLTKNSVNF